MVPAEATFSAPSDDEAKAFMSTERSELVPVVDEDSWSRYWLVPVCTAEAVTPSPAALMLATMSASDPLPVETLVAVADPAVNSGLFTWPWVDAASMVAVTVAPAVPLRVTDPPGVTVLSTLDVPSTLTMPSTPTAALAMADSPNVASAVPPVTCRLWLEPWSTVESVRSPLAPYPACRTPPAPAAEMAFCTAVSSPLALYPPVGLGAIVRL